MHYLQKELHSKLESENSELFKFIQFHALDGMWYWDLENPDVEYMDERMWEVLGYDPSTKKHSPSEWIDIIDPIDLEVAKANLNKHLADPNHPYDQIVRYKHGSGRDVWVRCRGVAIRDENGKPLRLLGCHTEVTDLKQSEEHARKMLHSYQTLVETQSLFFIKTDIEGRYTYANNCFLDRFGLELDEILGTNSLESIIPADHPKTFEVVAKCFKEPNIPHTVVLRKPYEDGIIRANQWEFYGMTNDNGEVTEIICVGVEVTDLLNRTLEIQKLLELQADKNQRLQQHSYITSHNIRGSVANMISIFELIKTDPDEISSYLEMLETSVNALDTTLRNLTKLLSEEKEAELSRLEEIDIRETLERIINLETAEIRQLRARVSLNCPAGLKFKTLTAYFDSIFHNLISNGLKYGVNGSKDGRLDINVESDDEHLSIEVRDYGKGFELENNAEHLFRLGTRLDSEKLGQGLGLFITRHHIKMVGAKVEVNSAKGKGASFKVIWND